MFGGTPYFESCTTRSISVAASFDIRQPLTRVQDDGMFAEEFAANVHRVGVRRPLEILAQQQRLLAPSSQWPATLAGRELDQTANFGRQGCVPGASFLQCNAGAM